MLWLFLKVVDNFDIVALTIKGKSFVSFLLIMNKYIAVNMRKIVLELLGLIRNFIACHNVNYYVIIFPGSRVFDRAP